MNNALVFWFTGLSGSGKTTTAEGVKPLLEVKDYSVLILDGDDVRKRINQHLGFSEQDIKKNNSLIADLCSSYREKYSIILVPIISPYEACRAHARNLLGEGFHEIYFSAGLDIVAKRDSKGLYAKADCKEIDNLIGYSPGAKYEAPKSPDFVVDSGDESINESIIRFYKFITEKVEFYGSS